MSIPPVCLTLIRDWTWQILKFICKHLLTALHSIYTVKFVCFIKEEIFLDRVENVHIGGNIEQERLSKRKQFGPVHLSTGWSSVELRIAG